MLCGLIELQHKLKILANPVKWDASCASSGSAHKDSRGSPGADSTDGTGIGNSSAQSRPDSHSL